VKELHPLGERVQVLASALDLASREKPVYNTEGDIQTIRGPDGSPFAGLMSNPTWPGLAQRGRDGPWRFHVMPWDSHSWYEGMAALRKKAEMILAEAADAGGGGKAGAGDGPTEAQREASKAAAKRQQPWKDNAPGFITVSVAAQIAAKTQVRRDIEGWIKRIGRMCQPKTCPWHYMRRGRRCKVNFVDFLRWLSNPENPDGQTAQEVLDKTAAVGALQGRREKWNRLAQGGPQAGADKGQ
jgi:hypothetical protein